MNIHEKAQELIEQFEAADIGNVTDRRYAAAYAVAHGREIAEAYLEAQQNLDAATAFLSGLTRLDWRDFRDDDFGEGQANAFQQIQRKVSDFLSSVQDGPQWKLVIAPGTSGTGLTLHEDFTAPGERGGSE